MRGIYEVGELSLGISMVTRQFVRVEFAPQKKLNVEQEQLEGRGWCE